MFFKSNVTDSGFLQMSLKAHALSRTGSCDDSAEDAKTDFELRVHVPVVQRFCVCSCAFISRAVEPLVSVKGVSSREDCQTSIPFIVL